MSQCFLRSIPRRGLFLLPMALAALLAAARPARADNLNLELTELAKDVQKFLIGRNETAVAVGQFVPLPGTNASAGPAIAKGLGEELTRLGIQVALRANLTVEGRYGLSEDAKSERLAVSLHVKIVDKAGEEIVGLKVNPRGIFGNAVVAALLGLTVDLPPQGDGKELDKKIEQSAEKPQAYLEKTRINAPGGQPFAIEILVKGADGKFTPRAPVEKEGFAFVELKNNEVYRVRAVNDADYEAAVTLTVDGLNMFAFSEIKDPKTGKPLYDRLLVNPKAAYVIPGWHRTNEKNGSNEFQITKYADSDAAKLYGNSANIGTVTVTFSAAWVDDKSRPADEPKNPDSHSRSADLGTKRGAETGDGYKEQMREFGVTRAAISVRYSK
jgi:hypothetical protein